MPRVRSKAPRRAAALLVATGAVLLAAACSSSSSDNTAGNGSGGGNGGGGAGAFTAYIECLNKNGVTIAVPTGGVRNRPSDGASRAPREFPSGQPRPSGSAGGRGGFPGGGGGLFLEKPANVDEATWQKAQTACASVRPNFGAGRPGGPGGNQGNGMNAAYANCLKQHGVTDTGTLNTADATVKKAVETCKVLSPAPSASPTA